ncbi:unnamed protein product [Symbiodinium necroappetens]|uniref:Uncharacterized protein n=1 Tax=Symbiodinium necroappetens TaxID=1628268 RepID=A0A812K6T9_9DINO|nr:unnamed protein product [Symbiodinium necroappetens]
MPVFVGNAPRKSRKAPGIALEVILADAPIAASRPGCMPHYTDPVALDCLTSAGFHTRLASRSKLRLPSPRWTFVTRLRVLPAPSGSVGPKGHAHVASSRRWPVASPSKRFPPAFKKGDQAQETIFRRLQLQQQRREIHDVGHLFDATLTGCRPFFIPAFGQAPREHRCRRSDTVTAVP